MDKESLLPYGEAKKIFRYDPVSGNIFRSGGSAPIQTKHNQEYLCVNYEKRLYLLHRLAWLLHYKKWPSGDIDHLNGIRTDNRIDNLRVVSKKQNGRNQKMHITNTSGLTGVTRHKCKNKWQAYIKVDGRQLHLGLFERKEDAWAARVAAEEKYGFHLLHGTKKLAPLDNDA